MLFVETKSADLNVDNATRLLVLDKLQERGFVPLIRSTRLNCYELVLSGLGSDRVRQMEQAIAHWMETEGDGSYVQGDLFCYQEYALFLIFGDAADELAGVRAGIVHAAETPEPLRKLDAFCRSIQEALETARAESGIGRENGALNGIEWRLREPCVPAGLARFAVGQENEPSEPAAREKAALDRSRAVELLEDAEARRFLRRVREAHADGRITELLLKEVGEGVSESLISQLLETGLLKREMLVSCRKMGRALFRLPSPDALEVITASGAVCSECGQTIANEKVEELLAPTERAATLLEDAFWLASRLHSVLLKLGIPESQIAIKPSVGHGEAHMMVHMCDEPFLFVLRDGDWTAAHARRTLSMEMETEAAHVIVVATGRIQDEGRVRLREHTRRQARGGSDIEVILVEGVDAAVTELHYAFERVSQKALADELFVLDSSLGMSAGHLLATRFQLMQRAGALRDLATAAGASAGSMSREA